MKNKKEVVGIFYLRDFEKISFEQFKKDVKDDMKLYNEYSLPKRDSVYTAGYDIYLLEDLTIKPGERKKFQLV